MSEHQENPTALSPESTSTSTNTAAAPAPTLDSATLSSTPALEEAENSSAATNLTNNSTNTSASASASAASTSAATTTTLTGATTTDPSASTMGPSANDELHSLQPESSPNTISSGELNDSEQAALLEAATQAQNAADAAAKAADEAQLAATRAAAAAALASNALEDYNLVNVDEPLNLKASTDYRNAATAAATTATTVAAELTSDRAATEEHGDLLEASAAAAAAAALSQNPQDEAVISAAQGSKDAANSGDAEEDSYAADFAISGLDYSTDDQPHFSPDKPDTEPLSFMPDHNLPFEDEEQEEHLVLHGNPASRGIAVGRISFLQRSAPPSSKRHVDDVEQEIQRFEKARNEAIAQLGSLYEMTVEKLGDQNAVVFQIHQMMLDDPEYVDAIESTIRDEQVNAEYAVDVTGQRFADMFSKMDNDYMQGRAADVQDVSHRLCDVLNHNAGIKSHHSLIKANEPIILATDDLAPSETVQLDQDLVKGILTSEGSSRSHTVIFARTLGLPAVINIGHHLNPELEGKLAIIDGGAGIVIIDPDEKTLSIYAERKRTEDALRARLEQFRGKETRTLSGRRIMLYANIGAVSDLDLVKTSDAEGIGLFRSEYIYLSSSDFPSEETQFNIYKETLAAMDGKKVVIRTLDIGADKTADYFMLKPEENPAMGMRAVRICLSRPEIFKTQLRALYRASVYGTLAIMFPMISSVEEVKECLRICKEVQDELTNEGKPFSDQVELGIMIETPASAIISDLLAEYVDFFSIGTNDLTQFTLAVDRQNAEVGRFLNPYHRAVIRLIEMTVNNAHKNGIWVGVCGELAADEGFTHELIRIGVDEISVVPSSILMLRARISTLG